MTARRLPPRPNLDQLKRQAKDLLQRARDGSAIARGRFRALPAHASTSDAELARAKFALHDAQSVVARESGFESWNAMRERVEALTLGFDAAVDEFVQAATDGRPGRAERLLALHPGIATASFHAALLLGDAATVHERLARDPALATQQGGARGWLPIQYLCHTAVVAPGSEREAGLVAVARALIAAGTDPNTRFPWPHHGVNRPVLWGAVCAVRSLALARALLEAGANASDGVTLTIAASGGDVPALDLLAEFGVDPNKPWATDGTAPLYAILHWASDDTGARWLIANGADIDPVNPENGETPLHVAAGRYGVEFVKLLVNGGADIARRRSDGRTPYAIARLSGKDAVAEWLLARGAPDDVKPVDLMVGACSRGDLAAARALLAEHPGLKQEIGPDHYAALYRAAEANDVPALEALLSCGFDPDHGDADMDMNALHKAAMAGWPAAVRLLLAHGASVHARDREFGATALVCAAEGARHAAPDRDHAAVGRMLLDAGSPTDWKESAEPSEAIQEIIAAWTAAA